VLVDDEPSACYLLSMLLKLDGFDVVPFTNPELALDGFAKDQFALLLTDVKMPVMSGFELYRTTRRIDGQIEVCFMANERSMHLQEFRKSFPRLSPDCLVGKPSSNRDLVAILDKLRLDTRPST
jgi:CheY-like chemotaxis protein